MYQLILGVILITVLILKIYDVINKYRESYKNVFNFNCVVAENEKLRKKGLMFRKKKLKKDECMLFDFKKPQKISLWMKNTYIPLDALYLNDEGRILDFNSNLKPKSTKSVLSNKKCRYAIEVNADTIKNKNINIGDYIKVNEIKKLH